LPVVRSSIFLRSSRIGQLLAESGQPKQEWRGMEMFLDKQVRAGSSRMEPAYRNFASNLQDIVEAGRRAGARVVLSTVATNLRDSAPFGSLHRPGLGSEALQSWSALVQQGAAAEAAQSYGQALQYYGSAAQIDDQYAELEFRIARCHWQLGDFAKAKEHYVRARDLDTLRFRADSQINEIIRSTATRLGHDAALLDAEALLSRESRGDVIGGELLYDHVHLTPMGSYLFASEAFKEVAKTLPPEVRGAAASAEPLTEAECDRLLAFTAHDRSRVAAEMADRVQRLAFDDLDAPVLRVATLDVPMPYSAKLEQHCMPQPARIAATVKRVVARGRA